MVESVTLESAAAINYDLKHRFGDAILAQQATCDAIPTLWVSRARAGEVLRYLKSEVQQPYEMLYDLACIDERVRSQREGQPDSDYTVVYHLLSFSRKLIGNIITQNICPHNWRTCNFIRVVN